ncbi:MAG: hypothetical protein HYZ28_13680 [Myxococcales bacterium]|nr:hypothetical protein [Myxococcales bacterium]
MRFWPGPLLAGFVVAATLAGPALARKPQQFTEPRRMTEEEIEAAKKKSKSPVHDFGIELSEPEKRFPWLGVSLGVLCLLIAAPFAVRAYRQASKEISGASTFGSAGRKKDDEEEAA